MVNKLQNDKKISLSQFIQNFQLFLSYSNVQNMMIVS